MPKHQDPQACLCITTTRRTSAAISLSLIDPFIVRVFVFGAEGSARMQQPELNRRYIRELERFAFCTGRMTVKQHNVHREK